MVIRVMGSNGHPSQSNYHADNGQPRTRNGKGRSKGFQKQRLAGLAASRPSRSKGCPNQRLGGGGDHCGGEGVGLADGDGRVAPAHEASSGGRAWRA